MIITKDTFEKFQDVYLHTMEESLKNRLSNGGEEDDDWKWNRLNELFNEPIDEEKLDELASDSSMFLEDGSAQGKIRAVNYELGFKACYRQFK